MTFAPKFEPLVLAQHQLKQWLDQDSTRAEKPIITICNSGEAPLVQTKLQLKLQFDDAMPGVDQKLRLATDSDVRQALVFDQNNKAAGGVAVIACERIANDGMWNPALSRSAALYMVLMAARYSKAVEQSIAEHMLDVNEFLSPNEYVCRLGDHILKRTVDGEQWDGEKMHGRIEVAARKVNIWQEGQVRKRVRADARAEQQQARAQGEEF